MINHRYLEIKESKGEGFNPCVDYGEWRVAILRYIDNLAVENISYLERHQETDEVFVLLEGRCILLIGDGGQEGISIEAIEMVPHKIYNVKKGAYHNHALSEDALVLIVENRDTGSQNSDRLSLSSEDKNQVVALSQALWGETKNLTT